MNIIDLVQGTQQWKDWRDKHLGASESPAVLGEDIYGNTPFTLWQRKTGQLPEIEDNEFIFAKGHKSEKSIKEEYRRLTGFHMESICIEHPDKKHFSASLDGYNKERGQIECKLMGSEKFNEVSDSGELPFHHEIQVQHQFMCSGLDKGDYAIVDPAGNMTIIPIEPNADLIARIEKEGDEFWKLVTKGIAPELSDADWFEPTDKDIINQFIELRALKESAENSKIAFEAHRKVIIEIAEKTHPRIKSGGVTISSSIKETEGVLDLSDFSEYQDAVDEYKTTVAKAENLKMSKKQYVIEGLSEKQIKENTPESTFKTTWTVRMESAKSLKVKDAVEKAKDAAKKKTSKKKVTKKKASKKEVA